MGLLVGLHSIWMSWLPAAVTESVDWAQKIHFAGPFCPAPNSFTCMRQWVLEFLSLVDGSFMLT